MEYGEIMKLTETKDLIQTLRNKYEQYRGTKHADLILLLCNEHEKLLILLEKAKNDEK
jgi:hypothetical protein